MASVAMLLDNHFGPDRRVQYERRLIRSAGMTCSIIAWDRRDQGKAAKPAAQAVGGDVVRIPLPCPAGGGARSIAGVGRFSWRVFRARRSLLAGTRALVVHDVYLLPLGWLLARLSGLPFIYDAHEDFGTMEAGRYPRPLLRLVDWLESRLAAAAAAVVVPGRSRVQRWMKIGIQPLVLRNVGSDDVGELSIEPVWDVAYCGHLAETRRLDILLGVAEARPDISIVVAGDGRQRAAVEQAAVRLRNLTFLGWVDEPDHIIASARVVYYGFDANHPYARVACPNTLYQAVRCRRPLVYFGAGEIDAVARDHVIGIAAPSTVDGVAGAIDAALRHTSAWDFDGARRFLDDKPAASEFVGLVRDLVSGQRP